MNEEIENKEPAKKKKKETFFSRITPAGWILIASIILVVTTSLVAVYLYIDNQKTKKLLNDPGAATKEELQVIIKKVNLIAELPNDEEPTLVTVVDKTKLADQPFFKRAENGDKVLIYMKAARAFIYRPNSGKIVDIGPVEVGNNNLNTNGASNNSSNQTANNNAQSQMTAINNKVNIAIYNGSSTAGLAADFENRIKIQYSDAKIISKIDAATKNYTKNKIVDLTGSNQQLVASMASAFDGEVSNLPAGETKPIGADILIIAAK